MRWGTTAGRVSLLIVCAFLPALLAARPEAAPPAPAASAAPDLLAFYHWLESPSEIAALNVLVDTFKRQYPSVAVKPVVTPRRGSVRAYPIIESRVAAGNPPDTFMMHVGYSADVFVEGGLVDPVDAIWEQEKLESAIPPVVRVMSRADAHYYAVPLNVHRTNLVWYNVGLLETHGIDPAALTTWEAFFEAAKKLRAGGVRYPIQLGSDWTVVHVFECIMASGGVAGYGDWVNGKIRAKDDPRLAAALAVFKQYLSYGNTQSQNVEWDEAIKRIAQGHAAFFVMGDWANGEFQMAGAQYGKDYGAFPAPGTRGVFGLTVDAFARPKKLANARNCDRWMKLVSSSRAQDAFSQSKGSIPARNDANPARYGPYQRSAIADFKSAKSMYPSLAAAVPQAYRVRVERAVRDFVQDLDGEKAAATLATGAAEMSDRFKRTWTLK
jgi:glucose/mannose transport system substrate-binding protein